MYELISYQKLESTSNTIEFTNIPQHFTDLFIVLSLRQSADQRYYAITFNGSTSNLTSRMLYGSEGSSGGLSYSNAGYPNVFGYVSASSSASNTFGVSNVFIRNYTDAASRCISLTSVSEASASTGWTESFKTGLWSDSGILNSIGIVGMNSSQQVSGGLAANSSAALYGVNRTAAIGRSPQAIGGSITYANGYWVHTFTGSGSFKPFNNMDVEYLVIAGGGGGGGADTTVTSSGGSGGGAGGYRSSVAGEFSGGGAMAESKLSLTASTIYSVTVGAGGLGGGTAYIGGTPGSNSSFSTVISTGGGGGDSGRGTSGHTGSSGGSGGGGSLDSSSAPWPGTAGQGYAGARGSYGGSTAGAGGGGAGGIGGTGTTSEAGIGGSGVPSYISGAITFRAAGGGGGNSDAVSSGAVGGNSIGGTGGGSAGNPTSGIANTGSGGGGARAASGAQAGASGSSGVVIVRYKA